MCDMFGIVPCSGDIDTVYACLLQFVCAGSFQEYIDWVSIGKLFLLNIHLIDDIDESNT